MELKKIVPEYYSKNPLIRTLFFRRLEKAVRLAEPKIISGADLNVIDLGCGDGTFLTLLEKKFKNINLFGIDIEPEALQIKSIVRADVRIVDLRDSGFSDNFFDIAFCLDVLEHFKSLEEPVKEIKRILKPRGLLIVSLPRENFIYKAARFFAKGTISSKIGPCSSPHFHKAKSIEKFLVLSGFKAAKKVYLPPVLFLRLFDLVLFENSKS